MSTQYYNLNVIKDSAPSEIFYAGYGRKYGSWISGRYYSVGDPIQSIPGTIESILTDELGLDSTHIDTASFDACEIVRNWGIATARQSIINADNSLNVLSELLYEGHCGMQENNEGKYKVFPLDTNVATPYLIERSQMTREPYLSRTGSDLIYNRFNVKYCYDYGRQIYTKGIIVNESRSQIYNVFDPTTFTPHEDSAIVKYGTGATDSLCGISQSRYRLKNTKEYSLNWLWDAASAEWWVKKQIEWLYAPKIRLDVLGWFGDTTSASKKPLIQYELGDQVRVSHPILDPTISNNFVFIIDGKTIDKTNRLVNLSLLQMR